MEGGPFPCPTLHPDAPAHEFRQTLADGQPQPRSTVVSGRRRVSLLEAALTINSNDAAIIGDLVKAYDSLLFSFNRVNVSAETKESLLRRSAELLEALIAAEPGNVQLMIKLAGHYIRAGDIYGNQEDVEGLRRKLAEHLKGLPVVQKLENLADEDREAAGGDDRAGWVGKKSRRKKGSRQRLPPGAKARRRWTCDLLR